MRDPEGLPPRAHEASTWRRYLHFWRTRVAADVDDELRFHVEMLVQRNRALGMSPDEARSAAERRLGDLARHSGECVVIASRRQRRADRALVVDGLVQDLRYALRTLARQKTWTAAAVLTLAVGIGATTAVYSVLEGLILNQLPYPAADRVVIPWRHDAKAGYTMFPSNRSVIAWHGARSIQDLQSYTAEQVQLTTSGTEPVSLFAAKIGSGFMRFAGVGTLFGRNFDTTETQAGAARVAILSEHLWRGRFAASRAVLGRRITLDDSTYTIIGVARDALRLPAALQPTTDIWLPAVVPHSGPSAAVIARLRPGVTVEAAQRELDSLSTRSEGAGEHFQILLQRPRDSIYIRSTLYLFAIAA
ncbi:MAG TPA: ABC transporter permease, partial [Gemmatimonadaceae bacterium]|nr:ABC transporter permease [Gemmatimonadaceae bacterium]